MADPQTRLLQAERRPAPINSVDLDARRFTVTFTTGAAVPRADPWTGERYSEELVVTDKAVRLDRINAGGPFLDSHRSYGGVGAQLGVIERAWIERGKGMAEIRFPKAEDNPDADRILRQIADDVFRNVSVGYYRHRIEVDKRKDLTIWRVVDWEPAEISLVTIPADPGAQVRSEPELAQPCAFTFKPDFLRSAQARMRMAAARSGLIR